MSLSTHVLDTAAGVPAAGVAVVAERSGDDGWVELSRGRTDADGRVAELAGGALTAGSHRLIFDVSGYFSSRGVTAFWAEITIAFDVADPGQHHHVPLLLSPFGYSTYRGS